MISKSKKVPEVKRKGEVPIRQATDLERDGTEATPAADFERELPERQRESPAEKLENLNRVE